MLNFTQNIPDWVNWYATHGCPVHLLQHAPNWFNIFTFDVKWSHCTKWTPKHLCLTQTNITFQIRLLLICHWCLIYLTEWLVNAPVLHLVQLKIPVKHHSPYNSSWVCNYNLVSSIKGIWGYSFSWNWNKIVPFIWLGLINFGIFSPYGASFWDTVTKICWFNM